MYTYSYSSLYFQNEDGLLFNNLKELCLRTQHKFTFTFQICTALMSWWTPELKDYINRHVNNEKLVQYLWGQILFVLEACNCEKCSNSWRQWSLCQNVELHCQGYVLTPFHCRKLPCVSKHWMGKIMSHMGHNCTWFHDFLTKRLVLVTWDVSILYIFSPKKWWWRWRMCLSGPLSVYRSFDIACGPENRDQRNNLCCLY